MHIDLTSPTSFAQGHPLEQYRWLQENAPVYWHEETDGPGFWALTRYEDVARVGREAHLFSSEPTVMLEDLEAGHPFAASDHKMMLMMDPPQHTQFRRLISKSFTRGPAQALGPRIAELSAEIVDRVLPRGDCEFVADVAGELPSYVIAELMGIPLEDGRELYRLTEIIHSAPESLPEGAATEAIMQMFAYAEGVYKARLDQPQADLASQIVHAEVDGRRLDLMDFQLFFMLLIDAGGDTTRNLVAGGLHELIRNPAALSAWQAQLTSDVSASARDELLRVVSPVIYFRRTATQDTDIGGQQIRAGDKVVRFFGAANHDPSRFEQPEHLDLQRDASGHIAFGSGTHVCLGQHIARVEIDCIFREVLARMTDFRLAEEPEWLVSSFISGIRHMPITFRAR